MNYPILALAALIASLLIAAVGWYALIREISNERQNIHGWWVLVTGIMAIIGTFLALSMAFWFANYYERV